MLSIGFGAFTSWRPKRVPGAKMFDLAIAALFGFPFGVLVGYLWRDHISRARRARYRAEQEIRRATDYRATDRDGK